MNGRWRLSIEPLRLFHGWTADTYDGQRPLSRNRGNVRFLRWEFRPVETCSSSQGTRSLTEMTMDDKEAYSSPIAAEAVGERLGSPPADTGDHAVRPVATSAGPGARIADKTAESVGERAGDAYADATTDEARERSRKVVRHAGMQGGSQAGQFQPTDVRRGRGGLRPRLRRCLVDSPQQLLGTILSFANQILIRSSRTGVVPYPNLLSRLP